MFEGFLDQCDPYQIRGWCRSIELDVPVFVDICIDDKVVSKVLANAYRGDLEQAGKGNGFCGFEYVLPSYLLNGSNYKVNVRYLDSDLVNSPFTLNTFISGDGQTKRAEVAKQYLHGNGIEIGALHNPLLVDGISIKYVDRMDKTELEKFYSDISTNMVEVDIVDEGEHLTKIEDNSQDFIICNHMLEHCINPIGTIKNHFQKLKKDGILFYSVPDKRFTFDKYRPLTEFKHLMKDYEGLIDNFDHYLEWAEFYYGFKGEEIVSKAHEFQDINHNIHFHVWDFYSFTDILLEMKKVVGFEILHVQQNFNEIVAVLKKINDVCATRTG